jgi:hypothetical protein
VRRVGNVLCKDVPIIYSEDPWNYPNVCVDSDEDVVCMQPYYLSDDTGQIVRKPYILIYKVDCINREKTLIAEIPVEIPVEE